MDVVNAIGKVRFSSAKAQRVQLAPGADLLCMEPGQNLQVDGGSWQYYVVAGGVRVQADDGSAEAKSGQLVSLNSAGPHTLTNAQEVRLIVLAAKRQ
jgi:mannose-6-phosphate isomerase-like protein (cupin superfamily)